MAINRMFFSLCVMYYLFVYLPGANGTLYWIVDIYLAQKLTYNVSKFIEKN